jgi:CRISPR-associated protein Csb2
MALIIEQRFPSGRFHATRWNQGAFGDAYGEWPPSPWRLLRALAARWFQYVRENGESKETEAEKRETILKPLLQSLAGSLPAFYLPPLTWRGPALKQYQPTEIRFSKGAKDAEVRKAITSLVEDHYRAVPPDDPIFWRWEELDLERRQEQVLDHLVERTLYFGRAESFSRLRRIEALPTGIEINCRLAPRDSGGMTPVLAHLEKQKHELVLAVLLAATDDKEFKGRSIPPGTAWYYAQTPRQPPIAAQSTHRLKQGGQMNCIQFAVGGRVYPPLRRWTKITDRFRGRVIRHLATIIAPTSRGRYDLLTSEQRVRLALICGKDGQGHPLLGHRHAFFMLWPDENGAPTRLVLWRSTPFTSEEMHAFSAASEQPISWDSAAPEWRVRLVQLPFETAPPPGLLGASCAWESATPFVPPAERHRFRRNGRARQSESPERILTKLLRDAGLPEPLNVSVLEESAESTWVSLHETRERRFSRADSRTPWVPPGFNLRVEFSTPVEGPLIVGDSCHFGLGLFASL